MSTPAGFVAAVFALAVAASSCRESENTPHEEKGEHHVEHEEKGEHHAEHEEKGHDEPDEGEIVRLTPAALKHAGIQTEKASHRAVVDALRLTAEVQADPDRVAHITPLVSSQVVTVHARPGDLVKKGQMLATLKSVELGEARADIASAKAGVDVAEDRVARQKQLLESGIGAQKSFVEATGELKRARAARSAARSRASVYGGSGGHGATMTVRSPLAGTVIDRHATAGEVASPERTLFVIADISRVWVVGRVYETDVGAIRRDTPARVRLQAHPSRVWEAKVAYVSAVLDERTRTASVRVELDNTEGSFKPGMFGSLAVLASHGDADGGAGHRVLAIPASAVQRDGDQSIAFVQRDEHTFERRIVTLGEQGSEYVEILSGLSEGESVAVSGTFLLKSEAAKHEMGGGHSH